MSKRNSTDSMSVFSDSASESNMSSISGLTNYEEELNNMRQLINNTNKGCVRPENANITYENRIKGLNLELQNSLKLNEQYKNKLFEIERKNNSEELSKFKSLFEQHMQLQEDYKTAQDFIKTMNVDNNSKIIDSNESELHTLNYHLYSQMTHWKNEMIKLKTEHENLIIECKKYSGKCDEYSQEVASKVVANNELKKKIMEQHVEYQKLLQLNMKLNSDFSAVSNNFEHLKKSENWYKSQLKQLQVEKSKLFDELSVLKSLHVTKTQQIESLQLEIENFRGKCNELELIGLKDRQNYENLLVKMQEEKKYESEKANICEIKVIKDESDKLLYENTIEDLKREVKNLQSTLQEQQKYFEILNKQNSEITMRNTIMQKTLNEQESTIDNLKNARSKADAKIIMISDESKKLKDENLLKNAEKNKLELLLNSAKFEKEQMDQTINNIREDFNKFLSRYEKLMKELQNKEKSISNLQKEKQEVFMNHNWQVCELEETKNNFLDVKNKYKAILEECKNVMEKLKKSENEIENKNKIIEDTNNMKEATLLELHKKTEELSHLSNANDKINAKVFELQQKIDEKMQENEKLNNELKHSTMQLMKNDESISEKVVKTEIFDLKQENLQLNSRISQLNQEINKLTNKSFRKYLNEVNLEQELLEIFNENFQIITNTDTKMFNFDLTKSYEFLGKFLLHYLFVLHCYYSKEEFANNLEWVKQKIGEILSNVYTEKRKVSNRNNNDRKSLIKRVKSLEMKCNGVILKNNKLMEEIDKENVIGKNQELLKINKTLFERNNFLKTKINAFEMQIQENKKRTERINRTLLRKIKEHMRGRNIAEKNSEYFKKMYENLHLEYKSLEFNRNGMQSEIESLKEVIKDKTQENLQTQKIIAEKNANTNENIDTICNNLALNSMQTSIDSLSTILDKSEDKLAILTEELSNCKFIIAEKDKEISALSLKIADLNQTRTKIDENNANLLEMYKMQLLELQENLMTAKNEKIFIERICRDLKFALKSSLGQNEIYKQKLQLLNQENEFKSLPNYSIPSPSIFDDSYITHLLQLSKPNHDNSSLNQLKSHINSLKVEMSHLQIQIAQKVTKNIE